MIFGGDSLIEQEECVKLETEERRDRLNAGARKAKFIQGKRSETQ